MVNPTQLHLKFRKQNKAKEDYKPGNTEVTDLG